MIRAPFATDFGQWLGLWEGYNAFYGREGQSALPTHIVEHTWERILDPASPVHALVAERREGLAGLAHFVLHKSTIMVADTCYLQDLFTSGDARGSGVGRALIEGVRDAARRLGAGGLYWHTQAANLTARHLYDSVARDTGFIVYRSPVDPSGRSPALDRSAVAGPHAWTDINPPFRGEATDPATEGLRMRNYEFETVDVFTTRRFGGNPLAVFPDAEGISEAEMQAIATEMNLSETTFVLPPADPANTARVRIFNRTAEMPFAGHPTIGTGYVLARRGRDDADRLTLEVPAGLVGVELVRHPDGRPAGGTITAPQPLSIGGEVPRGVVAACLGVAPDDVITEVHQPILASVGNPYVIAELSPAALSRCQPDISAFRAAVSDRPELDGRFSVHVYSRTGDRLRARMFAPLAGTWEDPATGSANAPLAALLLDLDGGDHARFEIEQGVEMGRPSLLLVEARRSADGIFATVSGSCVPVLDGRISLDPAP